MSFELTDNDIISGCIFSKRFYSMVRELGFSKVIYAMGNEETKKAITSIRDTYELHKHRDLKNAMSLSPKLASDLNKWRSADDTVPSLLISHLSDPIALEGIIDGFREQVNKLIRKQIKGRLDSMNSQFINELMGDQPDYEKIQKLCVNFLKLRNVTGEVETGHSLAKAHELFLQGKSKVARQYTTGIVDLDKLLGGGVRAGHIFTLIGVPGAGKTAIANQMMIHMSSKYQEHSVLDLSVELPMEDKAEYFNHHLASFPDIKSDEEVHEKIKKLKIRIVDDVDEIDEIIDIIEREIQINPGLKFVFLDYAQLVKDSSIDKADLFAVLGSWFPKIKRITKKYKLFMCILSQVDKASYTNGQLSMYSSKGSGIVPELSSYVGVLSPSKDEKAKLYKGTNSKLVSLSIQKSRYSSTDDLSIIFNGPQRRFYPIKSTIENASFENSIKDYDYDDQ